MNKLSIKSLSGLMSSDKARTALVIIGLAAVLLIFLSSQFSADESSGNIADFSTDEYTAALNAELTAMIENIQGAGKTKVLLTLENSYEFVYLDDDKTLTKINEPTIRGVAVLCNGGDNAVVREQISQMLKTVLSVSSSDISVSKLI